MNDALFLHRIHFAFTITFHYLFPQLTMGLAPLLAGVAAALYPSLPPSSGDPARDNNVGGRVCVARGAHLMGVGDVPRFRLLRFCVSHVSWQGAAGRGAWMLRSRSPLRPNALLDPIKSATA